MLHASTRVKMRLRWHLVSTSLCCHDSGSANAASPPRLRISSANTLGWNWYEKGDADAMEAPRMTSSDARLTAVAKRCKKRGGDCPCTSTCEAVATIERRLNGVAAEEYEIKNRRVYLETMKRRLQTPPATLKPSFAFDARYEAVIVFDGNEATFGYESSDGEWFEQNEWPFNEDVIWPDDCERLGFRVE